MSTTWDGNERRKRERRSGLDRRSGRDRRNPDDGVPPELRWGGRRHWGARRSGLDRRSGKDRRQVIRPATGAAPTAREPRPSPRVYPRFPWDLNETL